ncbi:MAG: LptF/LptG family permease [Polyangia bacterium]
MRLALYLTRQLAAWVAVSLLGVCLVFTAAQLVRSAPVFVGAGAGAGELSLGLLLSLLPVLGWALAPALCVAIFAVVGRMHADGEMLALDAAGVSRLRIALAPIALATALAAINAAVALEAAPRSQRQLRSLAIDLAGRAVAGRVRPGRVVSPAPGVTLYAGTRSGERLKRVFVEKADPGGRRIQIAAASGRLAFDASNGRFSLVLRDGRAFLERGGRGEAAIGFASLSTGLDLEDELSRAVDFVSAEMTAPTARLLAAPPPGVPAGRWGYALWRRIASPLGLLVLAAAATALALSTRFESRGAAAATAGALFLAQHLLSRLGETLAGEGALHPALAALAPCGLVAAGAALALAAFRARRSRAVRGVRGPNVVRNR